MPCLSSSISEVAATPQITSAWGLAFSASRRAVMMPVLSRTNLSSISGWAFSKPLL